MKVQFKDTAPAPDPMRTSFSKPVAHLGDIYAYIQTTDTRAHTHTQSHTHTQ
jgi:hypothetical protein